jgi:hypothetical protein
MDRFVDFLDNVLDNDPLPEEITLTELILHIKDIPSFQNSSTAIINRYVRPTNDKELSNTHQNYQSSSSESRPNRPSSSDLHPAHDFHTVAILNVFVDAGDTLLKTVNR